MGQPDWMGDTDGKGDTLAVRREAVVETDKMCGEGEAEGAIRAIIGVLDLPCLSARARKRLRFPILCCPVHLAPACTRRFSSLFIRLCPPLPRPMPSPPLLLFPCSLPPTVG